MVSVMDINPGSGIAIRKPGLPSEKSFVFIFRTMYVKGCHSGVMVIGAENNIGSSISNTDHSWDMQETI